MRQPIDLPQTPRCSKRLSLSIFQWAFAFSSAFLAPLELLLWLSWKLTFLMLLTVPLVAGGAGLYGQNASQTLTLKSSKMPGWINSNSRRVPGGIRTVRAFAQERSSVSLYRGAIEAAFNWPRGFFGCNLSRSCQFGRPETPWRCALVWWDFVGCWRNGFWCTPPPSCCTPSQWPSQSEH